MNNKKTILTDPYTGEYFEPKRSNQIFASEENRINFNNAKAKTLRNELNKINGVLLKNFKMLAEITEHYTDVKISKLNLLKKGFDFRFMTHLTNIDGKSIPTIYWFTLQKLENDFYCITNLKI